MRGDAVLSGLEFKHHSTHWGSQYFKLRDAGPKSKFGDQFVLFEVLGTCGVFRCRASWLSVAQFTRLVSKFANITLSAGLMETKSPQLELKSPRSLGLNPDRIALACEILEEEIDPNYEPTHDEVRRREAPSSSRVRTATPTAPAAAPALASARRSSSTPSGWGWTWRRTRI